MNKVVENLGEFSQVANGVKPAQQTTPPDTSITSTAQEDSNEQDLAAQGHVRSSSEPQEPIPEQQLAEVHSFSRKLAREYGVTVAVILGYLANRIQAIEAKRKDGLGYFTSIRKLAERYPYLSVSTIAKTLAMLRKEGVLKAENHNKFKYDRKLWYTFANAQVQKDAAWDPIRFKVEDAVKYGVVEAVLLANLRYWVNENRKETPDYTWHRMSAETLSKHLPFSPSSLRRAFEHLIEKGAIQRQKCHGFDNAFEYRIVEQTSACQPLLHTRQSDFHPHQPLFHSHQSVLHTNQPNFHTHQSLLHNDIILVDSVEKTSLGSSCCEDRVGKNTFITPAAAPSGSCVFLNEHTSATGTNQNEVTNAHDLPIPAEGLHSQVRAPGPEPAKQTSPVLSLAAGESPKPVLSAKDLLNRPVGYVPSSGSTGLSQGSSKLLGSGQGTSAPSVVAVSSSSPSSSSTPGDAQAISGKGVLAPSSTQVPATRKLTDVRVVSPFGQQPLSMPSGFTDAQLKEKLEKIKRWREFEEQAETQRQKKIKEMVERRWAEYKAGSKLHASPYANQENDKCLTPEEKVKVLKAGLRSRLKTGAWSSEKNWQYPCAFICTKKGLEMARNFFELNPSVTAFDLLGMMDTCCEIGFQQPEPNSGYDEFFYQRRGTNLSFLLKHLATINTKLDMLFLPSDVVYLDDVDSEPIQNQLNPIEGLEEEEAVVSKERQPIAA